MGRRTGCVVACACAAAFLGGVVSTGPTATARGGAVARDDDSGGGDRSSALRAELQAAADGSARFAVRDSSGAVTFIGASADHPLRAGSDDSFSTIGREFVDQYSDLFGVGRTDLSELTTFAGRDGTGGAVRYQQEYEGVPVMAGQIAVQIDADGAVISANGEASAGLDVDTVATVAPVDATATAIALTARNDGVAADVLTASTPELWIYDPSLMGATDPLGPRLVWRIAVSYTHLTLPTNREV